MAAAPISDLRSIRESIVLAHIQAEAVRHDIAGTLATFRHPRYDVPAMGGLVDGDQAVKNLLKSLLEAFPDFWLEMVALHHADDAVIVECKFGGTHLGNWAGIPPSGRPMEVRAVLIFDFQNEDLVCEKVFFDHASVVRQILG